MKMNKRCSGCDYYKNPIKILFGGNWRICGKGNTIKDVSMKCIYFKNSILSNMKMKVETKKRPKLTKRK